METGNWRRVLLTTALTLAHAPVTQAQRSRNQLIRVEISGLRNDQGQVLCALFSSADGFPDRADKALGRAQSPISSGRAVCEFPSIPAATYAVSIFHDENSNLQLDRNLVGIPPEGVGASNNARGHFGPPQFHSSAFRFSGGRLQLKITVHYL